MEYYDIKLSRNSKSFKVCFWCLLGMVVLIAICLLTGCKSVEYVPVETVRTVYVTKTDTFIQKDSIFCHDSVFIHQKGDTVWYEKWHTKYIDRWKERIVTDSFIKRDSIRVPYPVERKLSKWQSFCLDYVKVMLGGSIAAVIVIIAWLVVWIRKRYRISS